MADPGGERRTAPSGPRAAARPDPAADLARAVAELRQAETRLRARFLEHGLIDQAVGVLVARLGLEPGEAFDQLLEIERRSGRDLLEVAADLVGRRDAPPARVPMDEAIPAFHAAPPRTERAGDGDELAHLLRTDLLAWSGAAELAIALTGPDGVLEVIGADGLPAALVAQWRRVPPQMDSLLTAAVRTGAPAWAEPADPRPDRWRRDPAGTAGAALLAAPGGAATPAHPVHAAFPLRLGRGVIGAVEIGWPAGTAFPADRRREIAALVASAGPAVVRARRLPDTPGPVPGAPPDLPRAILDATWEPALLVTADTGEPGAPGDLRIAAANDAGARLLGGPRPAAALRGRLLAETLPWAAGSGALAALRDVLRTGTPLRDPAHAYLDPAAHDRRTRLVSLAAARLDEGLLLVGLRPLDGPAEEHAARAATLRRMSGVGSWEWDVATGTVHWSAEALAVLGAHAAPGAAPPNRLPYQVHRDDAADHARLLRTLAREGRPAHAEFRVLRSDGTIGHVRVVGEPVPGPGPAASVFGTVQDVTDRRRAETALELARIQLAAQRSRADSERQLADLLQEVIMPVEPARIPIAAGLEIAARYRPASAGVGVGGDWYGIFPLADSRLLFTVGDIAGHGFPAATAMAQLYHALYGLALTGGDSGELLRWLNKVTCSLPEFTIASACCALYEPGRRRLLLANAGHPSPVLVRGGAAKLLPQPGGTMLGVDQQSTYAEETIILEPGDVLLLYTDGLVERRTHSPEENAEQLLAQAAEPDPDLGVFVDRILAGAQADTDDDTCVVAVRFS
jgi:serine phosphatase RsbU (regulator of sigma subunit)/PAS domain-containing protein